MSRSLCIALFRLAQSAFLNEEVERIVLTAVDAHLKDQAHDETKVARWIDGILETCMQDLAQLSKPFKYMGKWFVVGLPRRCASLTLGVRAPSP